MSSRSFFLGFRLFAVLCTALWSLPCLAQQPNVLAPQSGKSAAVDREQFFPYWTTETGWRSELQLRNNLAAADLTVTPALRATDGTETPLSPVTVKPNEVKIVDIEAAVMGSAPRYIGTYGSVVLRYHSPSPQNLFAMLMIHNIGHSIAFHIDATGEDPDLQQGSREGIWWLPERHGKRLPRTSKSGLRAAPTRFVALRFRGP